MGLGEGAPHIVQPCSLGSGPADEESFASALGMRLPQELEVRGRADGGQIVAFKSRYKSE